MVNKVLEIIFNFSARWQKIVIVSCLLCFCLTTSPIYAQTLPTSTYAKAQVLQVTQESNSESLIQNVTLKFLDGPLVSQTLTIMYGDMVSLTPEQLVQVGETVIVNAVPDVINHTTQYWIIDHYRLPQIGWIITIFFIIVVLSAGSKGLGSLIGMLGSVLVISLYIVPQILQGRDPLLVTLTGSLPMVFASFYMAHGFKRQTTIALIATLGILVLSGLLSIISVNLAQLSGMGSEDAASLRIGLTSHINLKGLLLGSIMIGIIGVLDDITTSQVAAVWELKKANPKFTFRDLIVRAGRIGTEHIASLVNTLVMAYAGSAMPVFIFIILNPNQDPLWLMLNSELIAEEIIRTVTGSIGLIMAVPFTSILAAWYISRTKNPESILS